MESTKVLPKRLLSSDFSDLIGCVTSVSDLGSKFIAPWSKRYMLEEYVKSLRAKCCVITITSNRMLFVYMDVKRLRSDHFQSKVLKNITKFLLLLFSTECINFILQKDCCLRPVHITKTASPGDCALSCNADHDIGLWRRFHSGDRSLEPFVVEWKRILHNRSPFESQSTIERMSLLPAGSIRVLELLRRSWPLTKGNLDKLDPLVYSTYPDLILELILAIEPEDTKSLPYSELLKLVILTLCLAQKGHPYTYRVLLWGARAASHDMYLFAFLSQLYQHRIKISENGWEDIQWLITSMRKVVLQSIVEDTKVINVILTNSEGLNPSYVSSDDESESSELDEYFYLSNTADSNVSSVPYVIDVDTDSFYIYDQKYNTFAGDPKEDPLDMFFKSQDDSESSDDDTFSSDTCTEPLPVRQPVPYYEPLRTLTWLAKHSMSPALKDQSEERFS